LIDQLLVCVQQTVDDSLIGEVQSKQTTIAQFYHWAEVNNMWEGR